MEQMQRMMQQRAGGQGGPPGDTPQVDTAEQVYISSLALLKMLKHGQRLQRAQAVTSADAAAAVAAAAAAVRRTTFICAGRMFMPNQVPYPAPRTSQVGRACPWRSWA